MQRSEYLRRLGQAGTAGLLSAMLAATAAEAALPTGGMLLPRPRGPARADLPATTSTGVHRVPSATAYGLTGGSGTSSRGDEFATKGDPFALGTPASEPNAESQNANPFDIASTAQAATPFAERPLIRPRMSFDEAERSFAEEGSFAEEPAAAPPSPTGESAFGSPVAVLPDEWGTEPASSAYSDSVYAGLKGVCPVTLRDERRVVIPQQELFIEHAGRRYEFASIDAKAAFEADPEKYAPVLGGRDVVLTASGAIDAVGSLKHAGVYRERLYLFQSDDTCKTFYGIPRRYVVGE